MKTIVESPRSLAEIGAILLTSFRASRDLQERKVLRALLKRLDPRIVKGLRSTVPKKHKEPSKWRSRRKRDYQYDTQQRIRDLQQGTWKSANAQGWAYKDPQEAIAGVSSVPTVKVDIVANPPQGSHTGPWHSLPNQPIRQQEQTGPMPRLARPLPSCPVPKSVEVYEGVYTAERAMQLGMPVTTDRTRYKDSGAWFWCVPE